MLLPSGEGAEVAASQQLSIMSRYCLQGVGAGKQSHGAGQIAYGQALMHLLNAMSGIHAGTPLGFRHSSYRKTKPPHT